MPKAIVYWSGGKDSAFALYEALRSGEWQPAALLTTVTADYDRISMHGVRTALLDEQAASLGLPLEKVLIRAGGSEADYGEAMRRALDKFIAQGIRDVIFGDLFLEDVRRYREEHLAQVGMRPVFPLWQRPTPELARQFIALGFKATITCVDGQQLDGGFAGREYDASFLADLPAKTDPCGENGEFHSFVHNGPIFRQPVRCRTGERVVRDGRFHYCDLIPQAEV